MQFTTFAATALLAASASAYQVLSPFANATVAKCSDLTVRWSSVDTDAETFSVYISNFETNHWPPTIVSLAQNVPRDAGSVNVRIPAGLTSDFGWQINFINGTNTYVIYAQSPRFKLTGDCVDPVPTVAPTAVYGNSTVTATSVVHATSTVTIATPIVWVVEPSKPAGGAAVTVTSTATVFPSTCEAAPTGPVVVSPPVHKPTTTQGGAAPTGTGVFPTKPPQFTGAASSIQVSGALAAVAGAFALLM